MSRAERVLRRKLKAMLLYTSTFLLGIATGIFQEYTFTDSMHTRCFTCCSRSWFPSSWPPSRRFPIFAGPRPQ